MRRALPKAHLGPRDYESAITNPPDSILVGRTVLGHKPGHKPHLALTMDALISARNNWAREALSASGKTYTYGDIVVTAQGVARELLAAFKASGGCRKISSLIQNPAALSAFPQDVGWVT